MLHTMFTDCWCLFSDMCLQLHHVVDLLPAKRADDEFVLQVRVVQEQQVEQGKAGTVLT